MSQFFLGLEYVNPVRIFSNRNEQEFDTVQGGSVVVPSEAHRWEMDIALKPVVASKSRVSYGNLVAHRFSKGLGGKFTIPFPQYYTPPNETYPGLVLRTNEQDNGQVAAGSTQLVVVMDGIANYINVTYPAGLFVSFDGDKKVYMVTETFTFNEFSVGTMKLFPPLKKATSQRQDISLSPVIDVKYADNVDQFRLRSAIMNESISVVEAL